jgi:hypothetical protein
VGRITRSERPAWDAPIGDRNAPFEGLPDHQFAADSTNNAALPSVLSQRGHGRNRIFLESTEQTFL